MRGKWWRGSGIVLSLGAVGGLCLLWIQSTGCKRWESDAIAKPQEKGATKGEPAKGVNQALVKQGEAVAAAKGCTACHSTDGSKRIGPTFHGLFGSQRRVITSGKERVVEADADYIKRSIRDPKADLVKGFEAIPMVVPPITDQEIDAVVAYLQTLGKASLTPPTVSTLAKIGHQLVESKSCTTCHSLDGSRRVAPTLLNIFGRTSKLISKEGTKEIKVDEAYLRRSILDPDADKVAGYHFKSMPRILLTNEEVDALVAFLKSYRGVPSKVAEQPLPSLSVAEQKEGAGIYFNRCAGCHGVLRRGATGPALLEEKTRKFGTAGIKTFVTYGLPGGMPAWGKSGILDARQIDLIARFLQHPPPEPPELSLKQMRDTWKVLIPPDKRPTKPEHARNWQNYLGVVLRDAGQVAVLDGDTKERVGIVQTGFAVHILRSSGSGRYFYSIGRDGKVTMIDLWTKQPSLVAEVKGCYDARSVDGSKYKGKRGDFMDKLLIVGCYWPPSVVIFDGQTLEPKKIVSTSSYTYDTNEFRREARAAAIMASHHAPEWVINVKETGYVWLLDYSDLTNLKITTIAAEQFLHDGGFDSSRRYVLMAANARHKIAVVDTLEKKLVALVNVGKIPHPGRGANFRHPTYGPVWCTGHLGDNTIQCIGTDPQRYPNYAWKVVGTMVMTGAGGGNLFIKTHPNSKYLWADRTLHPSADLYRSIFVFDRTTFKLAKVFTVPKEFPGRAVHIEYNRAGNETIVSAWSPQKQASALLIYDDAKLELKQVIKADWLITPTGKWNVYNTMKDLY